MNIVKKSFISFVSMIAIFFISACGFYTEPSSSYYASGYYDEYLNAIVISYNVDGNAYLYKTTESGSSSSKAINGEGSYDDTYITKGSTYTYELKDSELNVVASFTVKADYSGNKNVKGNISSKYWGSWIEMDTGNSYYVNAFGMYKKASSNSGNMNRVASLMDSYKFDGDNILESSDGHYYFREGGKNRSFSATVSGRSDDAQYNTAIRALSSGVQGITGRRRNTSNASDSETIKSDSEGKLNFKDAVSGDVQKVSVGNVDIDVTPQYDGENIGSIPIVSENSYAFKTSYSINSDAQGFCYTGKQYTLSLSFQNIGDVACATSEWTVSSGNSKLTLSGTTEGNFTTIDPNDKKDIEFYVTCDSIIDEYIDIPLNITIESVSGGQWNDSVTLRFYRGRVKVNFNTKTFGNSTALNGFFIYPDGRSRRFSVNASTSINSDYRYIPWSDKPYILVFSGALEASNETCYSFSFDDNELSDLQGSGTNGYWKVSDIKADEEAGGNSNNDSVYNAVEISSASTVQKGYLGKGDVDFYKINVTNCNVVEY